MQSDSVHALYEFVNPCFLHNYMISELYILHYWFVFFVYIFGSDEDDELYFESDTHKGMIALIVVLSSKWFCESFSVISWYGQFCYCQCSSNVHIPFSHHDCAACSINGENKHYGTPVNPAAPSRIPGGSSSGSAVAVAADLVDFSLGIFSNWGIIGFMKYGSQVFFHSSNWVL